MGKEYDAWNVLKKSTDLQKLRFYKVREVWWCRLGVNIGTEQNGGEESFLRPVLIVRGLSRDSCIAVPLTTSSRAHSLRVPVGTVGSKPARANISQLRVIDTRRLMKRAGVLEEKYFLRVQMILRNLF